MKIGKMFQKFKEKEKFVTIVRNFNVNKATLIFKMNIVKLVSKYTKLKKSFFFFNYLKTYFKDIKKICKEKAEKFKYIEDLITFLLKYSCQFFEIKEK